MVPLNSPKGKNQVEWDLRGGPTNIQGKETADQTTEVRHYQNEIELRLVESQLRSYHPRLKWLDIVCSKISIDE